MKRTNKWGIYAPKKGVIKHALKTPSEYGNRIYIMHDDGYVSILAHLREILVGEGQRVAGGDIIGIMGDSGSDNKHLHFGLIPPMRSLIDLKTNCINPVPWLTNGGHYPCNTKVTYGFQHDYGDYLHEGIDFSGLTKNLIKGWRRGIMANTQRYYNA